MLAKGLAGSSRYEIVQRLGAGASGIVYEARDRERQARVALKTLTKLDASALYRFKREFRALADVTHRNLVRLYELVSEGDEWFFTMELVEGVEFLEYAWAAPAPMDSATTSPAISGERVRDPNRTRSSIPPPNIAKVDYDRVRAGLVQLVAGIEALHAAGKLHRDIKPSNVLVARDGRVIVVDFGIAKDLKERGMDVTEADMIVGTPQYMAPEQAAALELTPAADWYAVGALLYTTITGRAPIEGDVMEVLSQKLTRVPVPPRMIAPSVPDDLNDLCVRLLVIDPEQRANGAEILRRLNPAEPKVVVTVPPQGAASSGEFPASKQAFVGRTDVLNSLVEAFASVERGQEAIAFVQGTSGMGKSAIVRHFLDRLHGSAVVLAGRCFERESVPYKAFDSVIDALTQHLLRLRSAEQGALMPRDVSALARLFPVLDRVPAVADAPRRPNEAMDAQQIRKRAFVALRELLGRLGDRQPVVVFIDDLQWGDADSAALLRELVTPPDAPRMLLILAFRGEDVGTNAALASIVDRKQGLTAGREALMITLDALSPSEAKRLAADLLGGGAKEGLADRIASESGGSPFFVGELVRYVRSFPNANPNDVRLNTVLRERLHTLDSGALRLLQITALAGRPIAQEIAFRASALDGDERSAALSVLRAGSLVRAQGTRADDRVECFHDRIRDAAVASIDAEALSARHSELARALTESGNADPEALFLHSHAAGMLDRACEHAMAAAKKAALALAFDRSAQFHRFALELMPPEDERAATLRVELGDALANAGRGPEAAEAYLACTARASAADRLALQRRAAEELLFSGHVDQGLDVIADVLTHFGTSFARKRWQAVLTLLVLRLWVAIRGLEFTPRDASTIAATELIKLDVYLSASLGLSVVDTILAAPFCTRNLLGCLRVGEPWSVCRAICGELLMVSSEGIPARRKVDRYLERARQLSEEVNRPDTSALVLAAGGLAHHFRGEWTEACVAMNKALTAYTGHGHGVTTGIRALVGQNFSVRWEVDTFRYFSLAALVQRGRLGEVDEAATRYLRDAKDRGDLYIQTNLLIGDTNILWLAKDTPDAAEAVVTDAMRSWSKRSFQMQHWWELQALSHADLYRGKNADALARLRQQWGPLRLSLLMRVQYLRLRALHLRGRAALALAADGRDVPQLLAAAEKDARKILKERVPWADAMAEMILAGVARQRNDDARALARIERAVRAFEAADMGLWTTVAKRRIGEIRGGAEGAELVKRADEEMGMRAVKNPERMAQLFAPGFARK
jgi:serine/threonine protein kinase